MQFTLLTVALALASTAIAAPTASTSTTSAPAATPTSDTDGRHWSNCVDKICPPTNGTLPSTGISIYYFGYESSNAGDTGVRLSFQPSAGAPTSLEPVVIPGVFTRDSSIPDNSLTHWKLDFDLPCGVQAGSYDLALRDYSEAGVQHTPGVNTHSAGPYTLPSTDAC